MLLMLEKPRRSPAERAGSLLSHAVRRTATIADAIISWPFRVAENRRMMAVLGSMSDHDLRDIGLSRADLRDATAIGPGGDPSRLLATRRREGQHAGR